MALDLIPRRLLSFPNLSLPGFWDEDEEWLTSPSTQSGLSVYEDDNKVYVEAKPTPIFEALLHANMVRLMKTLLERWYDYKTHFKTTNSVSG